MPPSTVVCSYLQIEKQLLYLVYFYEIQRLDEFQVYAAVYI